MGISDILNVSKIKEENERLKQLLTPEMQNVLNLQNRIKELQLQADSLNASLSQKNSELSELTRQIENAKSRLVIMDDDLLFQDFALYTPKYDFCSSDEYKERLQLIRSRQKQLIKDNNAVSGDRTWTVNGSVSQGNKMVKDMQKLLLRAFNSECDEVIGKVKYNNIEVSEKRIKTSCDAISKLGKMMHIVITKPYFDLKIEELYLAFEYQEKKQEERDALKEARAEMREAAKLQKEIDEQRKKVEKEQAHYQQALITVLRQLENPNNRNNTELLEKRQELESQLGIIESSLKDLDYREANQRAGYVYVISNIGSFGKDVYKIGMTRRLEPMERIYELSDASVPFNFDVHAMIFSDDAPALEAALHRAFEDRKVNMVNTRREFFHVPLSDIKEVIKNNFDKTVEFTDAPDAEQFRISQRLKGVSVEPSNVNVNIPPVQTHDSSKNSTATNTIPSGRVKIAPSYHGEILRTKWGDYQMPDPYILSLTKGPRNDLKKI